MQISRVNEQNKLPLKIFEKIELLKECVGFPEITPHYNFVSISYTFCNEVLHKRVHKNWPQVSKQCDKFAWIKVRGLYYPSPFIQRKKIYKNIFVQSISEE